MTVLRKALLAGTACVLVACGGGGGDRERPLLNLRGSAIAPDEFLVVPQQPLEVPADLAALPTPSPGTPDRVAIDAEGRFLAALGGRPQTVGGVPAEDAALVAAARAGSGGTDNIREILRAEDAAFRADRARRIAKLSEDSRAVEIYDRMLLDAFAELARLRALGVKTPTAPAP